MASLDNFDANQVDPQQSFEPIPPGRYEVVIISTERKPTAAGTGEYLELVLQVVSGPFKGRQLWDRLNLWNPSEKAVQIARGALSSICRAVNVLTPKDSADLHNLPLVARVVQEQYDGGVSNKIKGYYPRETSAPTVAEPPAAAQKPASAGSMPWAKGKKEVK